MRCSWFSKARARSEAMLDEMENPTLAGRALPWTLDEPQTQPG